MQGLGGQAPGLSRGATMSGNKDGTDSGTDGVKLLMNGRTQTLGGRSGTFVATYAGVYEVAIYGGGLIGAATGAGFSLRRTRLRKDDALAWTLADADGLNTTVTFPDGVTITAQGGGAGGGASGGDVNLPSVAQNSQDYGPYRGSAEGNASPGGGAVNTSDPPGAGMLVITKIGD